MDAGILWVMVLICIVAAGHIKMKMNTLTKELNPSTSLITENDLSRIAFSVPDEPLPINTMQSWILHVETPDGLPVEIVQKMV